MGIESLVDDLEKVQLHATSLDAEPNTSATSELPTAGPSTCGMVIYEHYCPLMLIG